MAQSSLTTFSRALVLAGGGLAGIAWETGVLQGICDERSDAGEALLASDVLLGTSAGSTVAAQLSSGLGLEQLFDRQTSDAGGAHELHPGVSVESITELFMSAMLAPDTTAVQKLHWIGAIAAQTDTVAESVRREVIAHRLPSHHWPSRVLRVTGIDIDTGELVVFDNGSEVDLVDAVAASCAVPGVWPTVTIGDRRFMDGGVGSTVNMVAARDCAAAVALVPSGIDSPSPWAAVRSTRSMPFPVRHWRSSPTPTRCRPSAPTPSTRPAGHRRRGPAGSRGAERRSEWPSSSACEHW